MSELPFIDDPRVFQGELERLNNLKESGKLRPKRGRPPTVSEREEIHKKSDGRCHVCGEQVTLTEMDADHVKSHVSGGAGVADNYLAACSVCNRERWHHLPHEIQWMLKLGNWAKAQIVEDTVLGRTMAEKFCARERRREQRRKNPRTAQTDDQ